MPSSPIPYSYLLRVPCLSRTFVIYFDFFARPSRTLQTQSTQCGAQLGRQTDTHRTNCFSSSATSPPVHLPPWWLLVVDNSGKFPIYPTTGIYIVGSGGCGGWWLEDKEDDKDVDYVGGAAAAPPATTLAGIKNRLVGAFYQRCVTVLCCVTLCLFFSSSC